LGTELVPKPLAHAGLIAATVSLSVVFLRRFAGHFNSVASCPSWRLRHALIHLAVAAATADESQARNGAPEIHETCQEVRPKTADVSRGPRHDFASLRFSLN
jgi:hypothetical protein